MNDRTSDTTDILEAVETISDSLDAHIERFELKIHEHETRDALMESQLDVLADVVLGDKRMNFDGEIVRTGGLQSLIAAHQNGGIKVHFPWGKIILALVSTVGTIVVAIVQVVG